MMIDILWEHVFDDMPVERLQGTPDHEVDLRVDIESAAIVDRKESAISAHHTEMDRSLAMKALMTLPPRSAAPSWPPNAIAAATSPLAASTSSDEIHHHIEHLLDPHDQSDQPSRSPKPKQKEQRTNHLDP